MKTMIYIIYKCLHKNNVKTLKKMNVESRDNIAKFYKDFTSSFFLSTKFNFD